MKNIRRYLAVILALALCLGLLPAALAAGETLEDYLGHRVFAGVSGTTLAPLAEDVEGFNAYMKQYRALLSVERTAVDAL